MKDVILFDLDGTLIDPVEGITGSFAHALGVYGIEVPDRRVLYPVIGPPLMDSFVELYGFSPEQAREAVEHYRTHYRETGIHQNRLYEGAPDMLATLAAAGKTLLLATSKVASFADQILGELGIRQYFTFVGGSELDLTRTDKAEIIRYALESAQIDDLGRCIMVGDRIYDIAGAIAVGIDSIAVTYGYGDALEFVEATHVVGSVAMLTDRLLSL